MSLARAISVKTAMCLFSDPDALRLSDGQNPKNVLHTDEKSREKIKNAVRSLESIQVSDLMKILSELAVLRNQGADTPQFVASTGMNH